MQHLNPTTGSKNNNKKPFSLLERDGRDYDSAGDELIKMVIMSPNVKCPLQFCV